MNPELKQELTQLFQNALQPPFFGGFRAWVENNIVLPSSYAIPGRLDLGISPYLLKPAEAVDDPNIKQINLCMATQVGKSLLSELCIPYWVINAPGPVFRIFQSKELSDKFAEDRLIPLLKECEVIKPLLSYDRFSTKKAGIKFPHTSVTLGSSNTSLAHGMSVRYLLADELHEWEPGLFNKFLARTTAFAGRNKIICASQPGRTGSEWESICYKGKVYEWSWLCPSCQTLQTFSWSKEKPDGTYAGMNWDKILNPDDTTNIEESARTAHLTCFHCGGVVHDTPVERRRLNDTGGYICTKADGDPSIVTYMAPGLVNPGLSFKQLATQYLIAKKMQRMTGLDEQMEIFVEQSLGKFYKREEQADHSKILTECYAKEGLSTDWHMTMGVDVQRTGGVKYYTIRAWHKNGNESRRIAFGIARTFEEIEELRIKHGVLLPALHMDSGDGEMTQTIYQECLKHGQVIRLGSQLQYVSWSPTKGDQKVSYKHQDDITRLFSEPSNQDAGWPLNHKLKGIPAPLIMFSNFSLKTILGQLRDGLIPGVSWKIDHVDSEYDKQMYSEGLVDVLDKKSGLIIKRWVQQGQDNHWFDCEVLCLLGAIRANKFSATKINEEDIKKLSEASLRKE
jgi:phage terminase large subunit GpA-like protein